MAGAFFTTRFLAGEAKVKFVTSFSVDLHVSRPATAWVDVLCEEPIDADDLIGAEAQLFYGYDEEEASHRFAGVIESIMASTMWPGGGCEFRNSGVIPYRISIGACR